MTQPREILDRLVLGCAQLGMNYGVANTTGKPSFQECNRIVRVAWGSGIRIFDTAAEYGTSEAILGNAFEANSIKGPRVVTKAKVHPEGLEEAVCAALEKLRVESLYAMLIHDEEMMVKFASDYAPEVMALKEAGLIQQFGGSFYDCRKASHVLDLRHVDVVQVPFNVFDPWAWESGLFSKARDLGKDVMVRSAYLQGRVFLSPFRDMRWPIYLSGLKVDVDMKTMALVYSIRESFGASVVVGAETAEQLLDNVHIAEASDLFALGDYVDGVRGVPQTLYDPRMWRKVL